MVNKNPLEYFQPLPPQREALSYIGTGKKIFYGGQRGSSKAQPLISQVLTPFGFKPMGDIRKGQLICNPDGSISKVIYIHPQGKKQTYVIKFSDGAETLATGDHIWKIWITNKQTKRNGEKGRFYKLMTTDMMIEHIERTSHNVTNHNLCVPLTEPVAFNTTAKYEYLDPYILGLLLGDGCLRGRTITLTTADDEIKQEIINRSLYYDYVIRVDSKGTYDTINFNNVDRIRKLLQRDGIYGKVANEKFIPKLYKHLPIEQRFELAQGLFDTNGTVDIYGHLSYTTVSEQLAKDVQWLVRSLGAKCTITKNKSGYKNNENVYVECQDAYTLYINSNYNYKFVRLTRKRDRCKNYKYNGGYTLHREIISITKGRVEECQCITVDNPNGLYITDDFIVTHNSHTIQMASMMTAIKHRGITVAIFRRTSKELSDEMIPKMLNLFPRDVFKYKYLKQEKVFVFNNASRILFRAIINEDAAEKVQGVEYQLLCIDEAPNFDVETIMALCGSLRNAHIPDFIPTLLMTGNPGGVSNKWFKHHFVKVDYSKWKKQELEDKHNYVFVHGKASDNIYARDTYIPWLKTLSERKQKLWLLDDWDNFEGKFFDNWDREKHVVETFKPPQSWRRIGGIDLGWSQEHPTVFMLFAQDPDTNIVYAYKEYYQWGSVQQYVDDIEAFIDDDEIIETVYGDPSMWHSKKLNYDDESPARMFEVMFNGKGISLQPADNKRVNGWRIFKQWLEKPMVKFMDCCSLAIETLPLLEYSKNGSPEDCNTKGQDDACFVADTMIMTKKGEIPIQEIKIGDKVLTSQGFKLVTDSWCSGIKEVYEYNIENIILQCTNNHRIIIDNGKKQIKHLVLSDIRCILHNKIMYNQYKEILLCAKLVKQIKKLILLYLMGSSIDVIHNQKEVIIEIIIRQMDGISNKDIEVYIKKYGNLIMEKYQKDSISIIKMGILLITKLAIWNLFLRLNIYRSIQKNGMQRIKKNLMSGWQQYVTKPLSGIKQMKVDYGIKNKLKKAHLDITNYMTIIAKNVVNFIQPIKFTIQDSVAIIANPHLDVNQELMILPNNANYVAKNSKQTNIQESNIVEKYVESVHIGQKKVYNITVKDAHEYYANGVLVANCDVCRYVFVHGFLYPDENDENDYEKENIIKMYRREYHYPLGANYG